MLRVISHANRIEEAVTEFIRAQETPDPYLHQLRRVEIADFSGSEPEIELLRYLLASASGLEEMVIAPCLSSISDEASFLDRIKQFPLASLTALVLLKGGGMCICY